MNSHGETDARDNTTFLIVEGAGDNRPREIRIPERFKNIPPPSGPVTMEELYGIPLDVECKGPFVWRARRKEGKAGPST